MLTSSRLVILSVFFFLCPSTFAAFMPGDAWRGGVLPYKLITETGDPIRDLSPQAVANMKLAVDYYHRETQIKLIDVSDDDSIARGNYVEIHRQPTGRSYSNGHCDIFCGNPFIALTDDASLETAIHEIFHTLAFAHEHQRHNRDQFIELASNIPSHLLRDYRIFDYPFYYELDFGSFDYDSIMLYHNYMVRKATPQETLEVLKEQVDFERRFRILLPDSTPNDSFDNHAINNELSGNHEFLATPFKDGYLSAMFDIRYTGIGNRFHIKNIWKNQYLSAIDNNIALLEPSELDEAGDSAVWEFNEVGDGFTIKNVAHSGFLQLASNNAVRITTSNQNAVATAWLIKIRNTRDPQFAGLSLMDKVALHQWYGYLFRFRQYDTTPEYLDDNPAIHIEYDDLAVEGFLDKGWHSAMWALERVGSRWQPSRYIRIKNLWTQEYLHREFGELDLASANTTNASDVNLVNWWSAQWELVIKHDHFLVRNRWTGEYLYNSDGELALGRPPDDTYKWLLQEVDWSI